MMEGHFSKGAATVISLTTLQFLALTELLMNCPCLFISQLAFSVIVFDDHDACGKCGLEVGVGGFLFFISEGIFSIVGG